MACVVALMRSWPMSRINRLRKSSRSKSIKISRIRTKNAVPSGPISGVIIVLMSSNGFALEVSITLTGVAGVRGCGGEATAVSGLPDSCVIVGPEGVPPRQLLLQFVDRVKKFTECAPSLGLERMQLSSDVALVFGQLGRQIDQLPGDHPSCGADGCEQHYHCQQHRRDATEPPLKSPHEGRDEKC